MEPKELLRCLKFAIPNRFPILIKGAPGVGKTEIVKRACQDLETDLIISHPVVSDPTDYKGLPFPSADGTTATFLPFGDLNKLIASNRPTVFFLDDLGQASASVQAAGMQLILGRQINGHKVPDNVTFLAATNRREDKAGVMGILEPVKSRFAAIVELKTSVEDWTEWAIDNDMPHELIAFIKFRPTLLHNFEATSDIVNTSCPRTVAYVGYMLKKKMPKSIMLDLCTGATGEEFAIEFISFMNLYTNVPEITEIIKDPDKIEIPEEPSMLYAISSAISYSITLKNYKPLFTFINRLPSEFQTMTVHDMVRKNNDIVETKAYTEWIGQNSDFLSENF